MENLHTNQKPETQDNTPGQDPNLEKIRYFQSTWKNFFDYWKSRGVEADPYKDTVLKYPQESKEQKKSSLPYQDFGIYDRSEKNRLTESFEQFINETGEN
jgi:hypothetical protein